MDDDGSSGLLVRSWPAKPPLLSFKKDDEVIVFDKRNPTKVEGHAVVVEISGATVKVRRLDGKEIFVDPKRLRKTGVPKDPGPPDQVLVLPDPPEIGHPNSMSYRDKVREIVRKAVPELDGRFIDPRPIMELVQDAGGPFMGKERMESILTEMSEEIGIVPIDVVSGSVRLKLFIASGSTIGEAASKWSDRAGEMEILSPTSLKVLTKVEMDARTTATAREVIVRTNIIEKESFVAFCKSVEALAAPMSTVTTKAVFDLLPKDDGEQDDADGKFRKKIAEALKENGFLPQTSVVDGKKVKVFVRPKPEVKMSFWEASEARKKASREWEAREEKLRMERDRLDHEMLVEERRADREEHWLPGDRVKVDVKSQALTDLEAVKQEIQAPLDVEVVSPNKVPERTPEDLSLLPGDWKEKVASFLQGPGSGRTYVSLEGIILEAFDRVPQEIRVMDRGRLSQHLMSIGLVSVRYDNHGDSNSERKVFHVDGNPPSEEEMREHFKHLDAEVMRRLDIRVSDAPSWMTEEQRVNLSYLEHAVLLLCEDRSHNRIGLFPGHPDPDWQRRAVSSLAGYGLVVSHGGGWSMKYSGVKPSIEQALDRDFLLEVFWPRQFKASSVAPAPASAVAPAPEAVGEEEDGVPADDLGTDGPLTLEGLADFVSKMYGVLEDHAKTIRSLKKRIKELERAKDG